MPTHDFQQLLEQSFRANAQLLSRTSGPLKGAAVAARNPDLLRRNDFRGVLGDWIKLEIDHLGALSRSNARYLNDVVSLAESVLAPASPASATGDDATALTGTLGNVIAFQFQLDNPSAEPVKAAIEAEPWRGATASMRTVSGSNPPLRSCLPAAMP